MDEEIKPEGVAEGEVAPEEVAEEVPEGMEEGADTEAVEPEADEAPAVVE
jgi:hypothetical protein